MPTTRTPNDSNAIPPWLDRAAGLSWRGLVVGAALWVLALVAARLQVLLVPAFIALLLTTVLEPVANRIGSRLGPLAATWLVVFGFVFVLVASVTFIARPLATEFSDLGPTLEQSAVKIEDWLVDGPVDMDRERVEQIRSDLTDAIAEVWTADGALVDGAIIVAEAAAGAVLTLVMVFFFVKDGRRMRDGAIARLPDDRRTRAERMTSGAWDTLGRYVRGAAILGVVEATIMGVALALAGSSVVIPVVTLTFLAAFFPFVGAIVAGVAATLVALVSGGLGAAAVIAIVALLVQQFDNELLAPLIYGRALQLHPLVVISSVVVGGAVGGILGAFIAVPLIAVVASMRRTMDDTDASAHDTGADAHASEPDGVQRQN